MERAPELAGAELLSGVAATVPPAPFRIGGGVHMRASDAADPTVSAAASGHAAAGKPPSEAASIASGGVAGTQLDDSSSAGGSAASARSGLAHADGVCSGLSLSSVATKPLAPPTAAGASQLETGVLSPPAGTAPL